MPDNQKVLNKGRKTEEARPLSSPGRALDDTAFFTQRGALSLDRDRSQHRRFALLYEDLLA